MTIKPLYRYQRPDGGITVSTEKPEVEYIERYRLIADDKKLITNGKESYSVIDVENTDGWYEVNEFLANTNANFNSDEISGEEFIMLIEEVL